MTTITTANDTAPQTIPETLSPEQYDHQREVFRAHCAALLNVEEERLHFNEREQRTRMAAIHLNLIASYLEGQVFDDMALFCLESAVTSARDALEQHARSLAYQAIHQHANGEELTPTLCAEALTALIADEPEYSPVRRVLVDIHAENIGAMEG